VSFNKNKTFLKSHKKVIMTDNANQLKKLKDEFLRIKKLGFVQNSRLTNKDGGIGNTFEDYLGVVENNLCNPDFYGFEIKSKRDLSDSFVSLFSKSPSNPKRGANKILRENYGEVRSDEDLGLKKLYASIYAHNWGLVYEKYYMKLNVDKASETISLHIKDLNNSIIHTETNYSFEILRKTTQKKFNKLFIVTADVQKKDKIEFYHFTKAEVFFDLDFNKFISEIESGNIRLDLRIGVNKRVGGKSFGKTHDHGSGFRIKKDRIDAIFNSKIFIE
jgi:hypothetical protein